MLNDSLCGFEMSRWGSVRSLILVQTKTSECSFSEQSHIWNTGAFLAQFPTGKAYYVRQISNSRVSMVSCSQTLGWLAASVKLKAAHVTTCLPSYCSNGQKVSDWSVKPIYLKLFHAKASLCLTRVLPNCRKTLKLGAKLRLLSWVKPSVRN